MGKFWDWWYDFLGKHDPVDPPSDPFSGPRYQPPLWSDAVMPAAPIVPTTVASTPVMTTPVPVPLPMPPVLTVPPVIAVPVPSVPPVITVPSVSTGAENTGKTTPRVTTASPTIAITNYSTVLSDAEVQKAITALQLQIDRDFYPIWGLSANLLFVSKIKRPPINAWVMQILDTSDISGALGYHDMTNIGLPVGKVFAKDDQKYGLSWSVTLSHEILEMLGDPYIDTTVFEQNSDTTGMLYAYELCDAIEDDTLGYMINGVLVSDFVTPAFFESGRTPHSTKFDFTGALNAPLSLAPGGYLSVFPVNPATTGWTEKTSAAGVGRRLAAKMKRSDSRTKRRQHPKS